MQSLQFLFEHPDMEMRKEADGSVGVYREEKDSPHKQEEQIFRLVKPYMYDGAGVHCTGIHLELEALEGHRSRVTMVPDLKWLQAEERVYPVIIDPMTETNKTNANIDETYIFSNPNCPEDASLVYAFGSFLVGTSDGHGKIRGLLKFRNLPDIGKGFIIYAAQMYVWQYEYNTYGVETIPILAQEVKKTGHRIQYAGAISRLSMGKFWITKP
ncbi:MAG: hypothetical protein U0L05_05770 [Schaedlerella sp.]|nr:hypothetical protein [Schaedlerella sp.]